MRMNRVTAVLLASGAFISILPAAAHAQDVPEPQAETSTQIGDIVVTARRRTESLMSVPVAVSSVSAADLERTGATDLNEIARMAPQVSIGRSEAGTGAVITIRGVGTPPLDPAFEQSVTLNVDGVSGARGTIINLGFFDLEQVEVLKGPQALFFGKNSPAGVISLRSKGPGKELEGYVRAGYEFRAKEKYVEAAIGGPLTDTLGARIAVRGSDMTGWLRNVATGYAPGTNPYWSVANMGVAWAIPGAPAKGNYQKEIVGRLTLAYNPTDNFDATLKVAAGRSKNLGTSAQAFCFNPGNRPTTLFGSVEDPQQDCKFDRNIAHASGPAEIVPTMTSKWRNGEPYGRDRAIMSSLTMNLKLEDLTLTSVSSFADTRHSQLTAYAFTSFYAVPFSTRETGRSLAQELRLVSDYEGPLNFSLGGYYEDMKKGSANDGVFVNTPVDPATGRYATDTNRLRSKGKTASVFGQVRWAPVEEFELAAGARYTHEKREANLFQIYANPFLLPVFALLPSGQALDGRTKASNWSPEATLSYKPNRDTLLFVAYKTGFKSGGVSMPSLLQSSQTTDPAECASPTSALTCLLFDNETVKGFEAGVKTYLANRTVRLSATTYTYLYSNLQVSNFNQTTASAFVSNAASARVKGVEVEGEWRPLEGLRLTASATVNDAKFKSYPTAPCYVGQTTLDPGTCVNGSQNLAGDPLTRAPKYTAAIGASYDTPLTDTLRLGVNGDASYSSRYFTNEDHNPLAVQNRFWLINAGVRVFQAEKGIEVALIGTNLTNKYYKLLTNSSPLGGTFDFWGTTPRTRQIKLQGTYRF